MTQPNHGAIGPALGYYYQAIYALIQLFSSKNNDAYVSIETLDDVYHEDGMTKNLIQLKHSIQQNTKISIKSTQLWKTIKVWCDHIETNGTNGGIFTLSTVASVDDDSILKLLKEAGNDRVDVISQLKKESERVLKAIEDVKKENINRIERKKDPLKLPYRDRYKGCLSFIELSNANKEYLINNIHLLTDSFIIDQAKLKVIEIISRTTLTIYQDALAESILEWWDRECVKSLTRERSESLYLTELQEFISRKNAELYNDGFTDDLSDMEIPEVKSPNKIQEQQLDIISATRSQKRRSYDTEIKARIQRKIWMDKSLPSSKKLEKYDNKLIKEWSYLFGDMQDEYGTHCEEDKKMQGRILLDWSHKKAHCQIDSISKFYSNHDLIRGSYQMLSATKRVGWFCDFAKLINLNKDDE